MARSSLLDLIRRYLDPIVVLRKEVMSMSSMSLLPQGEPQPRQHSGELGTERGGSGTVGFSSLTMTAKEAGDERDEATTVLGGSFLLRRGDDESSPLEAGTSSAKDGEESFDRGWRGGR